jgi:hypothetical protein
MALYGPPVLRNGIIVVEMKHGKVVSILGSVFLNKFDFKDPDFHHPYQINR